MKIQISRGEFFFLLWLMFVLGMGFGYLAAWHEYAPADAALTKIVKRLGTETRALEIQTRKVARYEAIIVDMMDGTWSPEMGIHKQFVREKYGSPVFSYTAVHRPPGSPAIDIGEILDRKIQGGPFP